MDQTRLPPQIDPADLEDEVFADYLRDNGLRDADRHRDATLCLDELQRQERAA